MIARLIRFIGRTPLPFVMGAGLLLRVAAYLLVGDQKFPDSIEYVRMGAELFEHGHTLNENYMPLYPILTYLAGGRLGAIVLDIVISVLTIPLLASLTYTLTRSPLAARLSAWMAAVYPFFIFYSFSGLTETSFVFLLLLAFLWLYQGRFLPATAALALTVLIRPSTDLINPLLVVTATCLVHRESWRTAVRRVLVYFAVYVLLLAPWWIHNYDRYGRFVRLNLGDGIVLYSGNNPLNQSGGGVATTADGANDVDLKQFDSIKDPVERNEVMKAKAYAYIRSDVPHFLKMAGVKFLRFWRLWPYAKEFLSWKEILLSLASYGCVLALSCLEVVTWRRPELERYGPILLFILYLTLVHAVTIGSIRYRFPIEPFLILFASHFVTKLLSRAGDVPTR